VAETFTGRHGIVLLRGFLTRAQCEEVVKATDEVSLTLPLTIPAVKNGYDGSKAFSNLWMTFAGLVWDGLNVKKNDGYKKDSEDWSQGGLVVNAAPVPSCVTDFAKSAIEKAIAEHPGCVDHKGWTCTAAGWSKGLFTTIFNYYARQSWSKLSAHQDNQEPSLGKGEFWPVVSFSVGDSATFSFYPEYKSSKIPGPATTVELHSGDVLLFGGDSRLVAHSVSCPTYGKRQVGLKMVEGRLNVTLRRL
jgi:alkylated DNA repair dioxygenase AlkB